VAVPRLTRNRKARPQVVRPARVEVSIQPVSGQPLVQLQSACSVLKPQQGRRVQHLGFVWDGRIGGLRMAGHLDVQKRAGQLLDLG
jgi:hypothetical protein